MERRKDTEMSEKKTRYKRTVLFAAVGGAVGLVFSLIYINFGAT